MSFSRYRARHDGSSSAGGPTGRSSLRQPCLAIAHGARVALQRSPILRDDTQSVPDLTQERKLSTVRMSTKHRVGVLPMYPV